MGCSCSFAFGEAGVHQGDWKAAAEELHRWIHADATRSTQREILALLEGN